uniref:Uncharacterized protein n=1 Tax=Rhizophora mucronata TaxID=61149 RepID=A0A2P2MWQ4_RHIMU
MDEHGCILSKLSSILQHSAARTSRSSVHKPTLARSMVLLYWEMH